jgi:hypothetical protein
MYEHGSLPRARQGGLLEEQVGQELLLYDREGHTAHCLSPIAACVWRHCDGEHDVTDLAKLAGASEDLVAGALHELHEKDLLLAEPELKQITVPGESRREAIGRVARYGAAVTGASMIVSATAATPAMASSEELPPKCCQCYEDEERTKPCACSGLAEVIVNDKKCKEFCRSEGGFGGPVCSKKGDGLRKGTTCGGMNNECKA